MSRLPLLLLLLCLNAFAKLPLANVYIDPDKDITQGEMRCSVGERVLRLPLLRTDVNAQITGLLSRVSVTQIFVNTNERPIEAEYLFPLGERAAVDSMEFRTPDRVIRGVVQSREQAEQTYQQAKASGQRATVLHQMRDNLFRQKIANLMPGDTVQVRISYLEELDYDQHTLRFKFPLTVGPYYMPEGQGISQAVPDAEAVTTQYITPRDREAATVRLQVRILQAPGLAQIHSPSHRIRVFAPGAQPFWLVGLGEGEQIPNKDFQLEIPFVNDEIATQALVEDRGAESFLHLTLYPPVQPPKLLYPRELVFVVDVSGSMHGYPLDKSKEVMRHLLESMRSTDRFRLIVFSGAASELSPEALPATAENIRLAEELVARQSGSGGTELMAALAQALPENKVEDDDVIQRNILFLSDGYVGNEKQIIAAIRDRAQGRRVYTLGVGSAVNHSLLRGMAEAGGGYYAYVRQDGDAQKAMREFYARTDAPLLTGLSLASPLLDSLEMYPRRVALLTAGRPIQLTTKLVKPAKGPSLYLGTTARLPSGARWNTHTQIQMVSGTGLASLWARKKVAYLELADAQPQKRIEELGVHYQIMTSQTSFVAVEDHIVNKSGAQTTVQQPSQAPEDVNMQSAGGQMLMAKTATAYSGATARFGGACRGRAGGNFNTGYAESGSGGIGDVMSSLMGGGGGSVATKAKGSIQAPVARDIAMNSGVKWRSAEEIQFVVRARSPGLRHIYNKYLQLHPGFSGKIQLRFTIAASGEIVSIKIVGSSTGQVDFDEEVKGAVARWRFKEIARGECEVTVPFTFAE
jgi:Ca-activated chloride channel homolog